MRKIFLELVFVLTASIAATGGSSTVAAAPAGSVVFDANLGKQGPTPVTYRRRYYDYYAHRQYYAPRYYTGRVYEYAPPPIVYYPPPVVYYPAPVDRPYYGPPVAYEDVDVDVDYTRRIAPYYTGW